jgi:hypothetical protein
MRNTISIGGRVKKTPSTLVDADRYNFLKLADAEPNLGVPPANEGLISSDTSGNRSWLNLGGGLKVESGEIVVNEATLPIQTSGFNFSSSTTLDNVLQDFDDAITDAVAGALEAVDTDDTLTGIGTDESPLSVDYGSINIRKRDNTFISARLTNFLTNCLRISPETYRENNIAKVFTKEDIVSVFALNRQGAQVKARIDATLADDDNNQILLSNRDFSFNVPVITRTRKGTLLNIFARNGLFEQINTEVKSSINVLT